VHYDNVLEKLNKFQIIEHRIIEMNFSMILRGIGIKNIA